MLGELYQTAGATPELFHKFIMNASSDMSKASRRKQSKPNRLLANEDGSNPNKKPITESSTAEKTEDSEETELQIDTEEVQDTNSDTEKPVERDQSDSARDPMDLTTKKLQNIMEVLVPMPPTTTEQQKPSNSSQMVNFPCHTCGEVFASRTQQEQHMLERHSGDGFGSKNRTSPPAPMFPAAYHRLATDLGLGLSPAQAMKQSVDLSKLTSGGSSMSNGSGGIPKPGTPGVGGKGTAGTVFQREAYCEICQREFCNKYFLKTHKANIHGIIDPNDPKSAAVVAKVNQLPTKTNPVPSESLMTHKISLSPAVSMGGGSVSSKTTTPAGDNMDDFCEICQKHFCNKYYLKKHKVDVHNLRPDGSKAVSTAESQSDSRIMPPGVPVSSGLSLPMMVPSLNAQNNLNPTSMNNMLFVNPFMPSMAAMSMFPPMMQQQLFMQGISGQLAAAQAASQMSNISPELKKDQQITPSGSIEKDEPKTPASDKTEAFCDICKKEFCNYYYLQLHKASKHGAVDNPAALMMLMAEKEKADKDALMGKGSTTSSPSPPALINSIKPVVLASDKDRAKTSPAFALASGLPVLQSHPQAMSFDAMMAAKQADRITCDICNKEVCNKYFLKAHKQNMHGVSSPDDKRSQSHKDEQQQGNKVTPRTSPEPKLTQEATPESLIKIGIDPEAYCFLCKKEFCSKYFLRTHKLNIHGIKSEDTPKGTITPPTSISPISSHQQLQNPAGNPLPGTMDEQWRWRDQMKTGASLSFSDMPAGSNDKFTWRWKDMANSARVFCDICNKQLCNKYFLRTHKLKIHGVRDSGSPTKLNRNLMPASNMMADLARVSQSSLKRSASSSPMAQMSSGVGRSSPISRSQSCSPTASDNQASMREDVCQICGMVFADSEAVSEHMKLEHTDEEIELLYRKMKDKQQQKEVYRCSQCPYKTSVLANIYSHEARKHNSEMNTCKTCEVTFSHVHMLNKHMRQIHGKHVPFSAIKNNVRRKVQCNFCSEKFLTRQLCQSHIRNTHGIKIPLISRVDKTGDKRIFACDRCRYTSKSLRNLRMHQSLRHNSVRSPLAPRSEAFTMQEFLVKSVMGVESLATQTVSLPVYEPLDGEKQLNITLVPYSKPSNENQQENKLMDTSTS